MTEDILNMMAKAKASKKKVAKKKVSKKVTEEKEVVSIPDKEPEHTLVVEEVDPDLKFIQDTLKEYGMESNIPITHKYWAVCNKVRAKNRNNR